MVLGPVSCPAEIHCTTVFVLRNGKFSKLGGLIPISPLSFVSGPFWVTKCDGPGPRSPLKPPLLSELKYYGHFLNSNLLQRYAKRNHQISGPQKKICGHDMIRARFLKLSVDIVAGPLVNILNKYIHQGTLPTLMKMADVSPVYKKRDPFNKDTYRPISVLTALSKIFEKAIEYQLSPFLNYKFSNFLCAYRKHVSSQHESNKTTAAVLMDLSKAFDRLSVNLLTGKLAAYGVRTASIN